MYEQYLKKKVYAVVGVSRDKSKYGYKVFKEMKDAGLNVYPINPNATNINGVKAYPSLDVLPEKPDMVVCVVPPKITELVVDSCIKLGVKTIWLQPGSESPSAIKKAQSAGIDVIHNACIMIDALKVNPNE